jgi:CRISPR-associated endonuclease/helicase Cas3
LARQLVDDTQHDVEPHPSGVGYVVTGRAGWAANARDFSDEDDSSSTAPRELSLVAHLGDVRDLVRTYAAAVGLSAQLVDDLALAAHLHDLGKADPRFQAWLRDGDAIVAARGEVLAKSPRIPASRWAAMRARERAGYPLGGRHALLSVRLAESCPALLQTAHDQELVLHLVESHHGHCRPFAPVVVDERPLTVRVEHEGHALQASSLTALERLDSGVAERFFILLRRYGWWGLSYLEACLRLADHRASERAAGEPR